MPHFTLQIEAGGPILVALVHVSEGRRKALEAAGEPVPAPRAIRALVDTGASHTSIEPAILTELGLTPTGTIEIVTPSTGDGTHTCVTYDIDLTIQGRAEEPPLRLSNMRVSTAELFKRQGIHALIGRDVLTGCLLVYNGGISHFMLAF
jgi:hypothetical protein